MEIFRKDKFMELCIASLFSGSKGNALFIRYGKTSILIDAGMSARAVDKALAAVNSAAAELDAIFVTHEHIDHIKALKVLSKRVPVKIHLTKPTAMPYFPLSRFRSPIRWWRMRLSFPSRSAH